jgi:hypothetical protein
LIAESELTKNGDILPRWMSRLLLIFKVRQNGANSLEIAILWELRHLVEISIGFFWRSLIASSDLMLYWLPNRILPTIATLTQESFQLLD